MTHRERELRNLLAYALAALTCSQNAGERVAVWIYIESELAKMKREGKVA